MGKAKKPAKIKEAAPRKISAVGHYYSESMHYMKQTYKRKPPFILISSCLLIIAFTAISLISYYVANRSLNQHIKTNTLPLTSDNIYSEVQRDLLQPILVSSLMAQDTFVHNWIDTGEQQPEQMYRYLKSIQDRYNAITTFFVSEQTSNYYHSSGIIKQISAEDPADNWYFTTRKLKVEFDINLDVDTVDNSSTNLFVNHKVKDQQGRFLGIIGVGLASQTLKELIEDYQQRFGRQVYFIDRLGKVALQGSKYSGTADIHQAEGLKDIAPVILTTRGGSFSYSSNNQQYLIKSRFIPELDWYLIVEHKEHSEVLVTKTLWVNLSISLLVTLIVLLLLYYTLGGYQRRLEYMANTDPLTGTASRYAFESVFEQILSFAQREQHPVSTILVDIDHFKKVNDNHGHLVGDKVLSQIANILTDNLRQSDTLCRWGGDEFLIVLPHCNQAAARQVAEKMRQQIETSLPPADNLKLKITASFGVAEYSNNESSANLFSRTDKALYRAKAKSRNQVECTTNMPTETV